MADKRIYTIQINGLQESYDGVVSLRDVLSGLTDTVVNVSKQETKAASTRKEAAAGTDALAKATQKLSEWDRAYQAELALVNKELSDNKKEIKDAIKLQEAQAVVDAKQLDTYRDKQTYLSALNTLIRNHSTATEEDNQAIAAMMQESAALQQELKDVDSQMKIYVRNVGNYPGAAQMVVESHKSLKQELKELKTEMAEMLASGVSKTDEAYLKLAERAGFLKDAMKDANEDITNFASDTRGLTNAINLASSAVNAYQLYNSALQVFGGENEEAAKSMQKMMAVMTLLNSLQQVQNSLLENGSATARLYSKAVEMIEAALGIKKAATEADIATTEAATVAEETNTAVQEANTVAQELNATANEANAASTGAATTAEVSNTGAVTANTTATQANTVATNSMSVAQKAGAVASKTLSVALRAIPLMAIIGLVMALIQNWESIWNWFKKTFPVLDTLSKKFNKFGGFMNAVVTGAKAVGAAIVNWLINPFKTFADVIGKVLKGDFSGAWQAAVDGVKNQFKGTADAFKAEVVKGYAQGQEEMTRKSAAENEKRLEHHKNMITKQKNADGTYRKEYIKAEQAVFDNKKKMYKKGSDEYNKVLEDEARFHQQVEDAKTAATEKGTKARTAAASKAAAEAKKTADEAQKELEKYQKAVDDLIAKSEEAYQDVYKNVLRKSVDAATKAQLENLKKEEEEIIKDFIDRGRQVSEGNFDFYLIDFQKAMSKRRVIMANQLAYEAQVEKQAAEARIASARSRVAEIEQILKSGRQKYREDELKAEQDSLEKEISQTETALKTLFNKYADNPINLPINIDVEGLYERFEDVYMESYDLYQRFSDEINNTTDENRKKILQNQKDNARAAMEIMKLWNPDSIVDGFLGVEDAFEDVADKIWEYYWKLDNEVRKNIDQNTLFINVFDQIGRTAGMSKTQLIEMRGALVDMLDSGESMTETVLPALRTMFSNLQNINVEAALLKEKWEGDEEGLREYLDTFSLLDPTMEEASVKIKDFGDLSYDMMEKLKGADKELDEALKKIAEGHIKSASDIIAQQERIIKNFQEMSKDIKFEPVTDNSKYYDSRIIKLKETRENYALLRDAYETYLDSIEEGSEQMIVWENAWQEKLKNTKFLYGEDSEQYRKMVYEKEQADKAYVVARQKTQEQLDDLKKKENKLDKDYWDGWSKRIKEIYDIFNDNVMQPIQDGLGALFDFELEELQDALDEIEKLLDKAVEAREKSAERMKEINDELRADDGANKEALQQRLAEEEVLLVQREETERALQKEKEKKEKEIKKKEAQMRILELTQKLAEGIANTAVGVTAALKYGFPLGPVFAAIIGAMGALQTAIIAKQIGKAKSQMAKGGKVGENGVSRSHKQGGHRIEDTNIEVEGGEWVINKKSSQKYDTMLRAINDDNIGLVRKQVEIIRERRIVNNNVISKFASGGQINTLTATRAVRDNNDIQAITDLIRQIDFQPTVAVTDINKVNKNLVRVQQYAGKTV